MVNPALIVSCFSFHLSIAKGLWWYCVARMLAKAPTSRQK